MAVKKKNQTKPEASLTNAELLHLVSSSGTIHLLGVKIITALLAKTTSTKVREREFALSLLRTAWNDLKVDLEVASLQKFLGGL